MASTILPIRTSERSVFKQCRWRWQVSHIWKKRPPVSSPALRFGTLIHAGLEEYYRPGRRRGEHPAHTFAWLYEEELKAAQAAINFKDEDGKWADAANMGVVMLERYVDRWEERDKEYEVIASEQRISVPLRHRGKVIAQYKMTIDVTMMHLGTRRLWLMDHKTATAIKVGGLVLDDQAGSYWTFAPTWLVQQGFIKDVSKFDGMIFNFLRKAIPNPDKALDSQGRVLNKDGSISKQQPAAYFHREPVIRGVAARESIKARTVDEIGEIVKAHAGELPIYKNPGPLHNPNCAGCPAKGICELHEEGADWKELRDMTMIDYDPYDVYNEERKSDLR